MIDLITAPQLIQAAMEQMTRLWKQVVDLVSGIVLATGQGTSNWTMGWSAKRFMCIGQNDFSCLISPAMFDRFVLEDTVSCARYVDRTIYHLDGPGALQHLPRLLGIESLHCIQWIQGAGKPLPSRWLQLLQRIQDAGKSVQVCYGAAHGGKAEFTAEIEALCSALDPRRLFIWIDARSAEEADFLVQRAKEVCRQKRIRPL